MTGRPPRTPNFDPVARPYRWLEYLTFGPMLARCRNHFLPGLADFRSAMVLGDGDGRFLAKLLAANPHLHADAVDASPAMLGLLTRRAHAAHPTAATRLRAQLANALELNPERTYDLVVTHFFLDCLTERDLRALTTRITPHLAPGALWLVSDFRVPAGALRWPARILIRSLYFAFLLLTGLRATRLPDHAAALTSAGFLRIEQHLSLAGLLTAELWVYQLQPYPPSPQRA